MQSRPTMDVGFTCYAVKVSESKPRCIDRAGTLLPLRCRPWLPATSCTGTNGSNRKGNS